MNNKIRTVIDDNGDEIEISVPCEWEICDDCNGNGKHSRAIDGNGITASEWSEWDIEEQEYYLSGKYDQTCMCCNGSGKVLVEDYSQLSDDEQKLLLEQDLDEMQCRMAELAERRYGA